MRVRTRDGRVFEGSELEIAVAMCRSATRAAGMDLAGYMDAVFSKLDGGPMPTLSGPDAIRARAFVAELVRRGILQPERFAVESTGCWKCGRLGGTVEGLCRDCSPNLGEE